MADETEEVGARLTLKNKAEFVAAVKEAAREVNNLGDKSEKAGAKAKAASPGFGALGSAMSAAAGIAKYAAVGIAAGAAAATVAVVKMGVSTIASNEQQIISYTTLLHSASAAHTFVSQLQAFAARTPFELQGVNDAARQLLGVGIAAKQVIPTLTAWGDTAGALGLSQDEFSRAMLAYTQSIANGKIQAGDLLQMTQAGIPIWMLMAQATGKSVAQLRQLSQQGKLLAGDVYPKLMAQMEKNYGGAMSKQSETLNGLWSTLSDNIRLTSMYLLQPFEPAMKRATNRMIDITTAARAWATEFKVILPQIEHAISIGSSFGTAFALDRAFGGSGKLINPLMTVFHIGSDIAKIYRQSVKPALTDIGTALGPLGVIVFPLQHIRQELDWMANHGGTVRNTLLGIAAAYAVYRAAAIAMSVAQGIANAQEWIGVIRSRTLKDATVGQTIAIGIANGATKAWAAAQWLLNAAMDANPFILITTAVVAVGVAIWQAYEHSETFRHGLQAIGAWVKGPMADAFITFWHRMEQHAGSSFASVLGAIRFFVDAALDYFGMFIHGGATILGWVPGLGPKLKGAAKAFDTFKADVDSKFYSMQVDMRQWGQNLGNNLKAGFQSSGASDLGTTVTYHRLGSTARVGMQARATGGPTYAYQPYWVGEKGPEVFVPQQSGYVVPNSSLTAPTVAGYIDTRDVSGNGDLHVHVELDGKELTSAVIRNVRSKGART